MRSRLISSRRRPPRRGPSSGSSGMNSGTRPSRGRPKTRAEAEAMARRRKRAALLKRRKTAAASAKPSSNKTTAGNPRAGTNPRRGPRGVGRNLRRGGGRR